MALPSDRGTRGIRTHGLTEKNLPFLLLLRSIPEGFSALQVINSLTLVVRVFVEMWLLSAESRHPHGRCCKRHRNLEGVTGAENGEDDCSKESRLRGERFCLPTGSWVLESVPSCQGFLENLCLGGERGFQREGPPAPHSAGWPMALGGKAPEGSILNATLHPRSPVGAAPESPRPGVPYRGQPPQEVSMVSSSPLWGHRQEVSGTMASHLETKPPRWFVSLCF